MKFLFLIFSIFVASLVKSQHLNAIAPIKKNSIYSIKNKSWEMIIDPALGGRITELKFNDKNLLTTKEVHPIFWGSTLWPSPQKIWGGPNLVELDRSIYSDTVLGNTLKMVSQQDPHSRFIFSKEFSFDKSRAAFVLTYSIANGSDTIRQVAPWEVTRVQTEGLTFFPSGQGIRWGNMASLALDSNNVTWFDYQPEKMLSGHKKFFSDGKEGWVAQIKNGIVFIKCFEDQPIELAAPSEAEIEVYTNPDKTYLEVEVQGAYTLLRPGETIRWTVHWLIRELPKINAKPGSKELIRFVRNQIHFIKKQR